MTSMVTFEVRHRPDTGTGQEGLSAARVGVWGGQPFLWLTDVCSQVRIECVMFARVRVSVRVCAHECVRVCVSLCLLAISQCQMYLYPQIPTRLSLSVGKTWIFSSN